jgi:hypothetical protein
MFPEPLLSPFPLNLFGKSFDMDFPKSFCGVFELPLLRNAQKRHLKNEGGKKEGTYLPHPLSGYLPDIRRFQKKS